MQVTLLASRPADDSLRICVGESADGRLWGWLASVESAGAGEISRPLEELVSVPAGASIDVVARAMPYWVSWRLTRLAGLEIGSRLLVLGGGWLLPSVLQIARLRGCQWTARWPAAPPALDGEIVIPASVLLRDAMNRKLLPASPDAVIVADAADRFLPEATRTCGTRGTIVVAGAGRAPFELGLYPDVHRRGLTLSFVGMAGVGNGQEDGPADFERLLRVLQAGGVPVT